MEWLAIMIGALLGPLIVYLYNRWKYGPNIVQGWMRESARKRAEMDQIVHEEFEKVKKKE